MKLRRMLAGTMLALLAPLAMGQSLIGSVEASHKFLNGIGLEADAEYRSNNWVSDTDLWCTSLTASYKPLQAKWLKVGLTYRFQQVSNLPEWNKSGDKRTPQFWQNRHRFIASVSGEWKPIKSLSLSLRERFQSTLRPEVVVPRFYDDGTPADNKTFGRKLKNVVRTQVQAEWRPYKKCKYTPFASFEIYSLVHDYNYTTAVKSPNQFCEKWRAVIGSEYKLSKIAELSLYYRYTSNSDPDETDPAHAIGLGLSLSF